MELNYKKYREELDAMGKGKREKLNQKNKILFIHKSTNTRDFSVRTILISDCNKENNVIVDEDILIADMNIINNVANYTIPINDIKKIKMILSDSTIYAHTEILDAPILDGSQHDLYFSDLDKHIETECYNLWFWLDEKEFDDDLILMGKTKEKIEYTRLVIDVISKLQNILNQNNINFHIIDKG